MAELVPLGQDQQRVGAGERLVVRPMVGHAIAQQAARVLKRFGIVDPNRGPGGEQLLNYYQRWSFTHVVGSRLEGQPPHSEASILETLAEMLLHSRNQVAFLPAIDFFGSPQQSEIEIVILSAVNQRLHIFGKT